VARIIQINAVLTPELLHTPGTEAAAFRLLQAGGGKARPATPAKRK